MRDSSADEFHGQHPRILQEQQALKVGGVLAIAGGFGYFVLLLLHGDLPDETVAVALEHIAGRPEWPALKLALIATVLLWVGAFGALAFSLSRSPGRLPAFLAVPCVAIGATLVLVEYSILGYGAAGNPAALARALPDLTAVPIMGTLVLILRTATIGSSVDPATVLFGRTRRRVLGWLLGHPDEAYYLRQIVRQTGTAVGAVQRELELLTAAGLVRRTVQGRQVYFQANRDAPIFPELRGLFAKTAGLLDFLRDGLAPLSDRVQVAFVFGSAARGELRATSDIDLLVVGDAPFQDVVHALATAQHQLGRDINPTVYPPDEFRAKVAEHHHFLTRVLREPRLFVVGGDHELVGLGARQLADEAPDQPKRDSRPAAGRRARPRRQRR